MEIKVKQIGDNTGPYEIEEWYVSENDSINPGQNICLLEAGKAVVEVTASYSGKVSEICKKEGEEVYPQEVIYKIDSE